MINHDWWHHHCDTIIWLVSSRQENGAPSDYDAVDGILGLRTQEALIRYQRDHGLPVTGGIDQETVAALRLG
ncbi:MAG TPA: peptidoglycan-binding domain-containing protein [Chthoniobacterales bacterium]|jgi:peptidoglycan hydrolase-like protein with peptidoglycan-binding domain|nr:peptidoglycan-binding domain-containing protein [Chthoniobacterales bacterium]